MKLKRNDVPEVTRVELLRQMISAREVDKVIASADHHWHSSLGEEAIPVGCFMALQSEDISIPHYRSAVIASMVRGADLRRLIAGVLGKVTGPGKGRPRAEIMGDIGPRHLSMFSGTIGPIIGYAAGAALAAKLQGTSRVSLVTFGDGSINSGLFHESMNLASMLKLPAIFVCQNNQYAITTKSNVAVAGSITARGGGYGMPAIEVDGNDAVALYSEVLSAADRARNGDGPTFIHAFSYRLGGHWANDPALYRDPEEVSYWTARDPIPSLANKLISEGILDQATIKNMHDAARLHAEEALALAQSDEWPIIDVINVDAYAPSL